MNENTTSSDLHRSKRTLSNFDEEILLIIEKFIKVDYPLRFINSVNNEFQKGADHYNFTSFIRITKPFIPMEQIDGVHPEKEEKFQVV